MTNHVLAEKVVLQLNWEHEFQFAGYYAAQWQGYYQDKGIEAEIRSAVTEDNQFITAIDEVISGRADFGIGDVDILTAIDQGEELLILLPLFQNSPTAIATPEHLTIESIEDLVGLRLGMADVSTRNSEAMSMFRIHGVDPSRINLQSKPPKVKDLVNGTLDAIITYGVSAEYQARELGVKINTVETSKFGVHYFSEVLYTRKAFYQDNPKLVNDFVETSVKGWKYALNNKSELVERISAELPRFLIKYDDLHSYNEFFAKNINHYILWPDIELGNLDFDRWNKIYNDLRYIGIFENDWNLNDYILQKDGINYSRWLFYLLIVCVIFFLLLNLYFYKETDMYRYLMVFVVVLVSTAYYFFEKNVKDQHLQHLKFQSLVELDSIKSNLARIMIGNISLLKGFATHISQNPSIDYNAFNSYAEQVFEYGSALVNFAAAPNLRVEMVYPLAGNEGVLGLDYTKNQAQIQSVLNTTHTHNVVVSGPLNLVQGGDAIILRVAIYEQNNKGKFWGILSAPVDLKLILSMSGVFQQGLITETAIKKLGDDEKIVHGNQIIFTDVNAVSEDLEVGDKVWRMVARPAKGWKYPVIKLWLWRLIPLLVLTVLFYALYIRDKQRVKNRDYKEAIRRNERLLLEVGELAHIGGWKINSLGKIIQWTATSEEVLGHCFPTDIKHIDEIINLLPNTEAQKVRNSFEAATTEGMPFDLEVKYTSKADHTHWIRIISDEFIKNHAGFEVTGAIQDITYYKDINELIEFQATHDSLTNLLNRNTLLERANKLISDNESESQFMVLFIDIDDFKSINDSLGHNSGDQFLKMVASTLTTIINSNGILARYSGDEFVAVLPYQLDNDVEQITQHVLAAIRKEFAIDGTHVICSCSVGVALYPEHSHSINDLVSKADMAMYSAKQSGKNTCAVYSTALLEQAEKKASLKTALQNALIEKEFKVYFQPVVDIETGTIEKFEALLRWFNSDNKQYPTEEFIDIAEETGLITEIDLYVLDELYTTLNGDSSQPWKIAINVSPIIFSNHEKGVKLWFEKLDRLNEICEITVEITEKSMIENPNKTMVILKQLNQRGIKVAVDDFGVGYSSLNYLTKFPIQIIKIDKAFTSQIGDNAKTDALVRTLVRLAADLDMEVVAEGVETKIQHEILSAYRCQYGQGFLFSRALPFEDLKQFHRDGKIKLQG